MPRATGLEALVPEIFVGVQLTTLLFVHVTGLKVGRIIRDRRIYRIDSWHLELKRTSHTFSNTLSYHRRIWVSTMTNAHAHKK